MLENNIPYALLEKYGGAVPRYTSYPTAPHFQDNASAPHAVHYLRSRAPDEPVSLYFHIPFCRQLCHYCGCFTKVINHDQPLQDYLALLIEEINLVGKLTDRKAQVNHIHFGGGTPNILTPDDLQRIMEAVKANFEILDDADIAMEIDPRRLSAEKVKAYAALGFNRASLGVQDFQDDVQRAVNRIQPYDMVARCVEWLRGAGIHNINFDLMYGLPLQSPQSIDSTIEKTATLRPKRIALFGYAHVPWMRGHQKLLERFELPDIYTRFAQQEQALTRLIENGYHAIGMDHFALPDDALAMAHADKTLKRNFQGYTTDNADTIIGFGLSSISSLPQAYLQNTTDIRTYKAMLAEGKLPAVKSCALSEDDKMRREIIQTLMCYFEADIGAICRKYRTDPALLAPDFAFLSTMAADGLLNLDNQTVKVTDTGRPFVRVISSCFDAYISGQESMTRHAKAV